MDQAGGPRRRRRPAGRDLVALLWQSGTLEHAAEVDPSFGSPAEIGRLFLTDQLLAFEITSIVLLVAAVGGVVLGIQARERRSE